MVGVFKTVSSGATVDRSGRPGAQRHRSPAAGSLALQALLSRPPSGQCAAVTVMGAVKKLCTSSFRTLLCPTLASPPGAAGRVTAAGRHQLASAATGHHGWTEIEAGGAFVKLFARVQAVSELTVLHLISSRSHTETSTQGMVRYWTV